MRAIRRLTVRTTLPAPLEPLVELALNLRWAWHTPTRELFRSLDPETFAAVGGDPLRLLSALGSQRLEELVADQELLNRCSAAHADLHSYLTGERWYRGGDLPTSIAYFSAEFGITAVLPQYSGGLGILAGDHLKTASDMGIPLIGIGLLYRSGYFNQSLTRDGWQLESYPVFDPHALPLSLLRESDGTPVDVVIGLPGRALHARVWIAQVGRVPLLLLDSNVEENVGSDRDVTDRLYGGGHEHRLLQEMLLGIGGVRAVRAYCRITGTPTPEVYHANEGHAGFQGIERMRELVQSHGLDFHAALEATRAATVFTTHTPVPAGIDRFPVELIEQHFGGSNASDGIPVDQVLALGAEDYPGGDPAVFNMAVMGLRLAQRANGVSKLHGVVSRGMFDGLWPGFDSSEVPISSVTNGVHAPTWVAPEVLDLIGNGAVDPDDPQVWSGAESLDDAQVWSIRRTLRSRLVDDVRDRVRQSWLQRGASAAELTWIDDVLDPDVLTIGFARRVPSYKRLTLMLRDQDRLAALLTHPTHPIQIVVAGKSHPADDGGKSLIQQLVQFADRHDVRHRIVFLPNYDIAMAQTLYPGCDVWLNNPLRPLEACGTSGMKAALNGSLNLSILDGWWDELYDGRNGWAIPTADGVEDPDRRDDLEAAALYELIEKSVAPKFYDKDGDGVPRRWTALVKHTWSSLGPEVVASRMLRDYVQQLYTPAAHSLRALNDDFGRARELAEWKARVHAAWPSVRVDHVDSTDIGDAPEVGATLTVRAFVTLGALTPEDVQVELVAGTTDANDRITAPQVLVMNLAESYEGSHHRFEATLSLNTSGPFGYTVRILPRHDALATLAETGLLVSA